jgi:tRNA dimethylallyltransferase
MSLKPLISIIGTTGVGKSRLAIELASALSCHSREHGWHGVKVINADSMQVYSGADVITNKVPESERRGVEHLLMGFKEPGEQYVVGQWVNDAVREVRACTSVMSTSLKTG